jgi:hypothetical protein
MFILLLFYRYYRVLRLSFFYSIYMIELLFFFGFDILEYSWINVTIGICTLTDYSVAKKHRHAVCTVHKEMINACFLVKPQNQCDDLLIGWSENHWDSLWMVWPQNHWDGLSVVYPQNHWDDLSVIWHQNHWDSFSQFDLKTDSYGLVIWFSKSPRQFLGLCLKTKRAMVYRLCHKTDRRIKTVRGTHRDLAACFTRKKVGLGFFSLASRLTEVWRRLIHVAPLPRSCEDQVKDGWVDEMYCVRLCYPPLPFSMY